MKTIGFLFLGAYVFARYFESDWSLLYKSYLLLSAGVIILIAGIIFEKNQGKVAVLNEK